MQNWRDCLLVLIGILIGAVTTFSGAVLAQNIPLHAVLSSHTQTVQSAPVVVTPTDTPFYVPPTPTYTPNFYQGSYQVPAGITAICLDGTYSYSRNARGTCSHHGGVSRWMNYPD